MGTESIAIRGEEIESLMINLKAKLYKSKTKDQIEKGVNIGG
jgi:hypothetical protein